MWSKVWGIFLLCVYPDVSVIKLFKFRQEICIGDKLFTYTLYISYLLLLLTYTLLISYTS